MPSTDFFRVLGALIIREMITRYGRSFGGYAWAIIEPVGMIAVLSIAFSQILTTPPLGTSFVLFYATGYIPFHLFLEVSTTAGTAVEVNRPLMQFPKITPLDTVLARFILSLITFAVVCFIVFSGLLFLVEEPVRIDLARIALAMSECALIGLGVGTVNAVLFGFLPTWRQIWNVISRPLFLISGVFFTFDSMAPDLQAILWWNPLIHAVGEFRSGFYPTYEAEYASALYALGVGAVLFLVGALLLHRHRSLLADIK